MIQEDVFVEEEILVADDIDQGNPAQLIVYNDDHNTFDWVIQCFIEVLKHSFIQSEQLSMMIHFNGKAIVKTGRFKKLNEWRRALVDRGLNAVVERIPV